MHFFLTGYLAEHNRVGYCKKHKSTFQAREVKNKTNERTNNIHLNLSQNNTIKFEMFDKCNRVRVWIYELYQKWRKKAHGWIEINYCIKWMELPTTSQKNVRDIKRMCELWTTASWKTDKSTKMPTRIQSTPVLIRRRSKWWCFCYKHFLCG